MTELLRSVRKKKSTNKKEVKAKKNIQFAKKLDVNTDGLEVE